MHLHLTDSQRRAVRHGAVVAGLIATVWMYALGVATWQRPAADGLVYWGVNIADPYAGAAVGGENAYLYSPAFAQVFAVIGLMPREAFQVAWMLFLAAVAWWLARPWPASLLVLALPVSQDILIGNIHLLLAAAIVLGFRWAGTWSFVLLTKVTPGIGLLWFAVRREWRSLAIALGTTAAIVAGSFLLAPGLWSDWFALLHHDGGTQSPSLVPRLIIAALIVTWGALTERRWTVPLAAMLALPVVWMDSFAMLLGCVALSTPSRSTDTAAHPVGAEVGARP